MLILGSLNTLRALTGFTTLWRLEYHPTCPWYLLIQSAHSRGQRYLSFSTQTTVNGRNHGGWKAERWHRKLKIYLHAASEKACEVEAQDNMFSPMLLRITGLPCVLRGLAGLHRSAEGMAIVHSMAPHITSKRPESLDLKDLLGANTVTGVKFSKQSWRTLGDSHMWYFLLSYLNTMVHAGSSIWLLSVSCY